MFPPQNLHVEALTPNVTVTGDRSFKEVIKVKWWEQYGGSHQKIKIRATIWSSNPSSVYISEGNEVTILKRYILSHVRGSTTHNSQDMETTFVSINEWMSKENVVL